MLSIVLGLGFLSNHVLADPFAGLVIVSLEADMIFQILTPAATLAAAIDQQDLSFTFFVNGGRVPGLLAAVKGIRTVRSRREAGDRDDRINDQAIWKVQFVGLIASGADNSKGTHPLGTELPVSAGKDLVALVQIDISHITFLQIDRLVVGVVDELHLSLRPSDAVSSFLAVERA